MNKQPTYQSHQSVKVIDQAHPRTGQAGRVVDVAEREVMTQVQKVRQGPGEVEGQLVDIPYMDDVLVPMVGVKFDSDEKIEDVPLTALAALN